MAKKFWTYINTNKYTIGLTDKAAYIYDQEGNEIKKFKDLSYAYFGIVSPNQDLLVLKSTGGSMAIYSLLALELVKKFHFSEVDHSQDDNFIFTPDGKYLLNIERHIDSCKSSVSIYDTNDFSLIKRLFTEDPNLCLSIIEYDKKSNNYFLLGFLRHQNNQDTNQYFVCKFVNEQLQDMKYIDEETHIFYTFAKRIELSGFTKEAYKWLFMFETMSLEELKKTDISLATLWNGTIERKKTMHSKIKSLSTNLGSMTKEDIEDFFKENFKIDLSKKRNK